VPDPRKFKSINSKKKCPPPGGIIVVDEEIKDIPKSDGFLKRSIFNMPFVHVSIQYQTSCPSASISCIFTCLRFKKLISGL